MLNQLRCILATMKLFTLLSMSVESFLKSLDQ